MTRQEVACQVDVSAVLLVEARTAPTVEDVTTCGPCTYNITTQEHGNVFAEFESCFDVSVLPDGTA